jgi:hypothetical protein
MKDEMQSEYWAFYHLDHRTTQVDGIQEPESRMAYEWASKRLRQKLMSFLPLHKGIKSRCWRVHSDY